ncbi:MAG: hypothetical protein ACQERS_11255 [Bacteroidota bacterium]
MKKGKIIARFSIWDQNEIVLFDTEEWEELVNKIGSGPAPLRRIGDHIWLDDIEYEITNIFFGILDANVLSNNSQLVIEVNQLPT